MKILFHLGHPAHYHLFKNVIKQLHENGHETTIAIKKKDVLEDLLKCSGLSYINILPSGRKDNRLSIAVGQLKQNYQLFKVCRREKPNVLVGTSVAISHVGKLLGIPSINMNEDDAEVVPLYAKLAYPWATKIISPNVCSVGKWHAKKVGYEGFHELAYLHPENFVPNKEIANKYIKTDHPLTLIRFAKLGAHHDTGVKGISDELAMIIIEQLNKKSDIIISSERNLGPELEPFRRNIAPQEMHHLMAESSLFIGDSQTMSAEAGVLGVPFIRVNDFVGKIGYLNELEEKYHLGIGIRPSDQNRLIEEISKIDFSNENRKNHLKKRHQMLSDKINLSSFLYSYLVGKKYLK